MTEHCAVAGHSSGFSIGFVHCSAQPRSSAGQHVLDKTSHGTVLCCVAELLMILWFYYCQLLVGRGKQILFHQQYFINNSLFLETLFDDFLYY